jgi:hypothetical protein
MSITMNLSAQEISELRVIGQANFESGELIDQSIRDVNGDVAAGIMVLTDLTSLAFEARNGVVKVNSSPGKYVVFVSPTERVLTILSSGYKPLTIYLYDVGIRLKSGQVWKIEVTGTKQANKIPINIRVNPSVKSLLLDGNQVDPNQAIMAELGTHQLRIEQLGYRTVVDSITVTTEKTLFEYELKQVKPEKLIVRTNPKDASVLIDNKLMGLTPYTDFYYPGIYQLKIVKNGFRDIDQTIEIEVDKPLDLNYTLVKNVGNLSISVTPSDAQVFINKRSYTGQKQIELSSGTYLIEVSKDGFAPISETILLKEYEQVNKSYSLKRLAGNLRFRINDPDVDVELYDNSILYKSWKGIEYLVDIPAGTYKVIAKKSGFQPMESWVIIKENEENQFTMEYEAKPLVAGTPVKQTTSDSDINKLEEESRKRLEAIRQASLDAEKNKVAEQPTQVTPVKPVSTVKKSFGFSDFSSWNFSYIRPEFPFAGFENNITDSYGLALGLDVNGGFFALHQQLGLSYHEPIENLSYRGIPINSYMHVHYNVNIGAGISLFVLSPFVSVGLDYNYIEAEWDSSENSSFEFLNGVVNYGAKLRFPGSSFGFHAMYTESFEVDSELNDFGYVPFKRLTAGFSIYF